MFVSNACMAATASCEPDTVWENSSNEQHYSLAFAVVEMVMEKRKRIHRASHLGSFTF